MLNKSRHINILRRPITQPELNEFKNKLKKLEETNRVIRMLYLLIDVIVLIRNIINLFFFLPTILE